MKGRPGRIAVHGLSDEIYSGRIVLPLMRYQTQKMKGVYVGRTVLKDLPVDGLGLVETPTLMMTKAFFEPLSDGLCVVHDVASGSQEMQNDLAGMGLDPVLEKINPLPGAECWRAISDRDAQ